MPNNKDSKKPEAQIEKDQGIELKEDLEKYANGKIEELTNKIEALKKEWQEEGGLESEIVQIDTFLELFKKEVLEIQKEKEGLDAKVNISESFYQHNTKIDELQNKEVIKTTETPVESEKNNLQKSVENILIKFNKKINGLTVTESIKKDIEESLKETKEEYESILSDVTINDEEKENKIKALTNVFGDYLHYEEKERIIEDEVTMAEPISDKAKSTVELDDTNIEVEDKGNKEKRPEVLEDEVTIASPKPVNANSEVALEDTNIDDIPETSDKPERPKVEVTMAEPISESEDKDNRNILRRFGDKLKYSGIKTKEVLSTSAGRKMVAKGLYDTSTTIVGVKFATDIALATAGKGDLYNYFKQKRSTKRERGEIMELMNDSEIKDTRTAYEEKINNSENLSAKEKAELLSALDKIMDEHKDSEEEINEERNQKTQKALDAYLQNKIKGGKIAKDAMYLALTTATLGSGTLITRAGAYGLSRASSYFMAAAIERGQKASQQFDKDEVNSETEGKNRINEIVKDVFITSTKETYRSLRGKGKTEASEHKTMDRIQALGNIARALGIVATNIDIQDLGVTGEEISEFRDSLIDNLEEGFDNTIEVGEDLVENVKEIEVVENVKEFAVGVNDSLKEVGGTIAGAAENLGEKAGDITTNILGEDLINETKEAGDAFGDRVSEGIDIAKESEAVADAKKFAVGVSDSLKEAGSTIAETAIDLKDAAGDITTNILGEELVNETKEAGDAFSDRVSEGLDLAKESKVVAEAKEFAVGATSGMKEVGATIAETTKDAVSNIGNKAGDILGEDTTAEARELTGNINSRVVESVKEGGVVGASEEINLEPSTAKVDIIDSSEVKGSDSIWKSARTIFERNPSEFGYDGDTDDLEAISKWAKTQTANAILILTQEQGGDLTDLVHDGDKVILEMVDGKPHLSFEASSGIEAGHLPVVESSEGPIIDSSEDGIPEPIPAGKIHISSELMDANEVDGEELTVNSEVNEVSDLTKEDLSKSTEVSSETQESPLVQSATETIETSVTEPSSVVETSESERLVTETTSDVNSESEKLEGNYILKSELPTAIKSMPLEIEKFMEEHNISFKDGNLIGLKNIDTVSFETMGDIGNERSVESLRFFENNDGSIRAEIIGGDKTDIFKINKDGEWSDISEEKASLEANSNLVNNSTESKSENAFDDLDNTVKLNEVFTNKTLSFEDRINSLKEMVPKGEDIKYNGIIFKENAGKVLYQFNPNNGFKEVMPSNIEHISDRINLTKDSGTLNGEELRERVVNQINNEQIDNLIKDSEIDSSEILDKFTVKAVEAVNLLKPELEFNLDKIETGDLDYLNQVKESLNVSRIVAEQHNKIDLAETCKSIIEKIDSRIEDLSLKVVA